MFGHKRTQPGRETARAAHPAGSELRLPPEGTVLERMAARLATEGLVNFGLTSTMLAGDLERTLGSFGMTSAAREASAVGL